MSMFHKLFNGAKRKLGTEAGNASIEFVISVPVFILLFVSIFELGMAMTRLTMLEHGLDMAMRDIRLGTGNLVTQNDIRDQICEEASILSDCQATLNVEMVTIETDTWDMPSEFASCVDRANDAIPVTSFENGGQNDIMFIRACYVVDPFFPTIGLSAFLELDASGGMHLVASSAFSQEPE